MKSNYSLYDPEVAAKIMEVLDKNRISYKNRGAFIDVPCPFHQGSDRKKNFWIHKSGRIARCWTACTPRTDWEGYAQAAHLRNAKISDSTSSMAYITQALAALSESDSDDKQVLPCSMAPWVGDWRLLRADFLSKLGVFKWFDDRSDYYRILFPITMGGELVGYQAGRAYPEKEYPKWDPKYRASDGLPSTQGFFGLDQLGRNLSVVVIVEGLYDCLRLWQQGIPAIANIGSSSTWTEEKAALLTGLPHLKHIVTAFDMDGAGKRATKAVKNSLSSTHHVVRVRLPKYKGEDEYHDPGSAPTGWHKKLRSDLINELGW